LQVDARRGDGGDRPPHGVIEVADVGVGEWPFRFEDRERGALDRQDDAEEGEDGDPAAHGPADRLLQRADEDDQAR
jgi:hypothetical protein